MEYRLLADLIEKTLPNYLVVACYLCYRRVEEFGRSIEARGRCYGGSLLTVKSKLLVPLLMLACVVLDVLDGDLLVVGSPCV